MARSGCYMTNMTTPGSTIGSCVTSCTESAKISCTTTDFANKQGVLCYVGTFGSGFKRNIFIFF